MQVMTDYPERLPDLKTVYLGSDYVSYPLVSVRPHNRGAILRLEEVDDRDAADWLRGQLVYISIRDAVPLEDGEYYFYQLIGLRVESDEGEHLGEISDLIETGANDVYVITRPDGGDLLLPAIPQVVLKVDIPGRVMRVHLLDGLG